MITEFNINRFEIQSNIGKCSGMDDHFDIYHVFEISKFDTARLTCVCLTFILALVTADIEIQGAYHPQWESLENRWSKIQLTLLHKVVQDLVDIPATDYLTQPQ